MKKHISYILIFFSFIFLISFFILNKTLSDNMRFTPLYKSPENCMHFSVFNLNDGNFLYLEPNKDIITFNLIDTKAKKIKKLNELKREFLGFAPDFIKLSDDKFLVAFKRSIKENKKNPPQMLIYLYDYKNNKIKKLNILSNNFVSRSIFESGNNMLTAAAAKNDYGCPNIEEIINYDLKNDRIISKTKFKNADFCAMSPLGNGRFLLYGYGSKITSFIYQKVKYTDRKTVKKAYEIYDSIENKIIKPDKNLKPVEYGFYLSSLKTSGDKFLLRHFNGSGSIYTTDFKPVEKFSDEEKILDVKDNKILIQNGTNFYLYGFDAKIKELQPELNSCAYLYNSNELYKDFIFNCNSTLKSLNPKEKTYKNLSGLNFLLSQKPSFYSLDNGKILIVTNDMNYIYDENKNKIEGKVEFSHKIPEVYFLQILNSNGTIFAIYNAAVLKKNDVLSARNIIEFLDIK